MLLYVTTMYFQTEQIRFQMVFFVTRAQDYLILPCSGHACIILISVVQCSIILFILYTVQYCTYYRYDIYLCVIGLFFLSRTLRLPQNLSYYLIYDWTLLRNISFVTIFIYFFYVANCKYSTHFIHYFFQSFYFSHNSNGSYIVDKINNTFYGLLIGSTAFGHDAFYNYTALDCSYKNIIEYI